MITWFIVVAVVATLAGVVAVAVGLGGTFATLERAAPQALPAGEISPEQLRGVRFATVFGGYQPEAVDALLVRVADQWQARLDAAVAAPEQAPPAPSESPAPGATPSTPPDGDGDGDGDEGASNR